MAVIFQRVLSLHTHISTKDAENPTIWHPGLLLQFSAALAQSGGLVVIPELFQHVKHSCEYLYLPVAL